MPEGYLEGVVISFNERNKTGWVQENYSSKKYFFCRRGNHRVIVGWQRPLIGDSRRGFIREPQLGDTLFFRLEPRSETHRIAI